MARWRGELDVVVGEELAGLEDDFEVGFAAGFADGGDFFGDFVELAGEEGSAVDDHVDLIGALGDGELDVFEAEAERVLSAGETGGDGGDVECSAGCFGDSLGDAIRVDADGGAGGAVVALGHGGGGFAAEVADFAVGVAAFEGGEVHHGDGELEAGDFGIGFDGALGEGGGALVDHCGINHD